MTVVRNRDNWVNPVAVQHRTVAALVGAQALGGIGISAGIAVGGLLAEEISGSAALAGVAQTATVLGAAILAVPLARLSAARGRRVGLATGYAVGAVGSVTAVVAGVLDASWLLLAGMAMFGGATASGLQARYAAVDLAAPERRGRDLSTVVWATTVGAVVGPNLAEPASGAAGSVGLPPLTGPFLWSIGAFTLAVVLVNCVLRPDPLLTARGLSASNIDEGRQGDGGQAAGGPGAGREGAGGPGAGREGAGGPGAGREGAGGPGDGGHAAGGPGAGREGAGGPGAGAEGAGGQGGGRVGGSGGAVLHRSSLAASLRIIRKSPQAVLALVAIAVAHTVMVGVMVMTPVHMSHAGAQLHLIGWVISGHVAGMYAASPIFGWLADRLGRIPVTWLGAAFLMAAVGLAGSAPPHASAVLGVGLFSLGLGWSASAGSTLLTESVPAVERPGVQGLADLVMGLCGAAGGAVAGVVVALTGYGTLNASAAVLVVPVVFVAWWRAQRAV